MTGAVLAGGASRRMGLPKEGARLPDGRPMLLHVLDALRAVCPTVAVVGAYRDVDLPQGVVSIPDLRPGEGPLAGLEALLSSGLDDDYLVLGCDQPLATPALLARLDTGGTRPAFFRDEDGAEHHPFPGRFPASLAQSAREALDRGERSPRRVLRDLPVDWITIPAEQAARLRSLNTPDDLADAVAAWPWA